MRKKDQTSDQSASFNNQQNIDESSSQYSYLLIHSNDGTYGEEAMTRLNEIFTEYCAPGIDVIGYPELRELLCNASVLPPVEFIENYVSSSSVGLQAVGLSDAFTDQTTFESFVVEVLVESFEEERRIKNNANTANSNNANNQYSKYQKYKGITPKKVEELENDIELESSSFVICSMIPGK